MERACESLRKYKRHFDHIAFTGYSGSLVAPYVCAELEKYPLIIRKNETCHGREIEQFTSTPNRVLFLDDFVDYGTTLSRCFGKLHKKFVVTGIHLYRVSEDWKNAKSGDQYNNMISTLKQLNITNPGVLDLKFISSNHGSFCMNKINREIGCETTH